MPRTKPTPYLGRYLRELRRRSGLTLRQVEEASSAQGRALTYDYLSRAETGRLMPAADRLVSLAQFYEVPTQSFLDAIELGENEALAPASANPVKCRELGIEAGETGDYRRAYACFLRSLHLFEKAPGLTLEERAEQLARTRNNLAIALMRLGKYQAAQLQIERVLQLRPRSQYVTARALNVFASIQYQLDRVEVAEGVARSALHAARRTGDEEQIGRAHISLANTQLDLGKNRLAATHFGRAIELLGRGGPPHDLAVALFNLGTCRSRLKEYSLADEAFARGLSLADESADPRLKARGLLDRGRSLFDRGEAEQARAALQGCRSIAGLHEYRSELFHSSYYLWRMALGRRAETEAGELFKTLKRLRLQVDQRTEEMVSFDACLAELRSRRRRKGGRHAKDSAPSSSFPSSSSGSSGSSTEPAPRG